MFGFKQLFEAFLFWIISIFVKNVRGRGVLNPHPNPTFYGTCMFKLQKKTFI